MATNIPFYNEDILPCIAYPITNSKKLPERYLGARAVSNPTLVTIKFHGATDEEMKALHDFWEVNCNYGLTPFVIAIPISGYTSAPYEYDFFLVRFVGATTDTKGTKNWNITRKLKVVGEVSAIVDDAGNFVTSDAQEGLISDSLLLTDTVDYYMGEVIEIPNYRKVIFGKTSPTLDIPNSTLPIYDQSILPCITFPLSNTRGETQRYLGTRAVTGDIHAQLNIVSATNDEVKALDLFWKDGCNYGLEPFIIKLPIFGRSTTSNLLVMFSKDITDSKNEIVWNSKRSIKVLGLVVYTTDINDDFVLSDEGHYVFDVNGNYVALMSKIQIYKEITYELA